jgi:hypothetical protein
MLNAKHNAQRKDTSTRSGTPQQRFRSKEYLTGSSQWCDSNRGGLIDPKGAGRKALPRQWRDFLGVVVPIADVVAMVVAQRRDLDPDTRLR